MSHLSCKIIKLNTVFQIILVIYSLNGNDNLSYDIGRISTLNCSDPIVNSSIYDINHAIDFLDN